MPTLPRPYRRSCGESTAANTGAIRRSCPRTARRPRAYDNAVEVTENGTVVLTYFDDRNNDPADVIALVTSTIADGADVHAIRLNHR